MITTIIIREKLLRDALISHTSGVKQTHETDDIIFYQKNQYIFAFSENLAPRDIFNSVLEEYQSDKIFFVWTGFSVDTTHEIGDIILPNVFLKYNSEIETTEITTENRDSLIGNAQFLEIFDEQKDYYVEDYGLSIGGIIVSNTPKNNDFYHTLMSVYEGDIYSENNHDDIAKIIQENLVPTLFLGGVIDGKKWPHAHKNPYQIISENIMTTIRLLSDDENDQ